ncbi:DENN domain-containing protein 1B isoform X2 [Erpetoichthys calabaricus]|uniref:DENN domain-containing protein 1B isoform X2 n=1 Tax=Erpetoichthys calabaricus TaxID=27687 RepID=UPI00109F4314|nr:DENN domain-containing protein 1B isoform X2 [Erpetoichthys calabaricus]
MDSRIKENPERTFDLLLQVGCPSSENEDPVVLWKFPKEFEDQDLLQMVPKFCCPFDIERVSQNQVGQHFTFVLTDLDSKQRFGFCRLTSGCKVCLCILSYLPWFEIYYKLLNTMADYLAKEQENDLSDMLKSLYSYPVPMPNTPVNLSVYSFFIAPEVNGLPTIPESRNLTEYFVAVDINNMLQLYASMLHERRIIITSSKLSTLTACVHGSTSMLCPMFWQHIYIPVLPPHLLDYCCAPMPYVIGVHLSLIERVKNRALEDVVILNVDTNTLETPFEDLQNLPSDVVSSLKSKLKKQSTATGSGVARAFLRAQAALFGTYRDALRYKPGQPITFCEESFVNHRSSTMKAFLEKAVNLQLFKQFIDGRLAKLNAGRGFTDVFEEEINEGGFCGANNKSYQQWLHTVKKGGALINTAVTKASPAVKTAYKFAKNHAKQGIKEMKSMLKQREADDEDMFYGDSPTSTKSLSPKRQQKYKKRHGQNTSLGCSDFAVCDDEDEELDTGSKLSSEDSGEVSIYIDGSDDSFDLESNTQYTGEMDLLGEILDTLSTHSSDQGRLSGAKSLDFFRSMDDIDYKSVNKSNTPSESNLAQISSSSSEQTGWNLGQDDSIIHGRLLPPSPRRQSYKGLKDLSPSVKENYSLNPQSSYRSDSPRNDIARAARREKQPKETLKYSLGSVLPKDDAEAKVLETSISVPWEKTNFDESLQKDSEEKGLLEEIDSTYRQSSYYSSRLRISDPSNSAAEKP